MHHLSSKLLAGFLVCLRISSFAEEISLTGSQHFRSSVRHIESGGVGYNQGYTTLDIFLAPDWVPLSIMPFIDLRGHVFDNGKFAANAGLGLRSIVNCRVYGANIYYDYRNTRRKNYNQIGLGFETLGTFWDFRANGYLPIGSKANYDTNTTSVLAFENFYNHYAYTRETLTSKGKTQFAMTGVNAEVAFHILKNENIDLYAAIGPYYYNYSSKDAVGGQARLGARIYEYLSLDLINSYDTRFHENFQGSIGINIPFGPKPKTSKSKKLKNCSSPCLLAQRIVQDVVRQEIIVIDKTRRTKVSNLLSPSIDPLTGSPYFFVFVDNTSNSQGTYESPYPTFALAQQNSNPGDIIYVFPGDGTTTGMNSGIALQADQKFWGSGISHSLQTSKGTISIPAQSSVSPTITNTNLGTEGNAITLATNNAISGFTIRSAIYDSIYGSNPQNLEISYCTIEHSTRYIIEALFPGDAIVSLTNNQFLNNDNGVFLDLHGTSTIACSNNTFNGQPSESSIPLTIIAANNSLAIDIENNIFSSNATGSILITIDNVLDAKINTTNNNFTNNGIGSLGAGLASSLVIRAIGTSDHCSVDLIGNTCIENAGHALSMYTDGLIKTLEVTASSNTILTSGSAGLMLATPVETLTFVATNNTIKGCQNNGIAVIGSGLTSTGDITINNNTITNIADFSSGIALTQIFAALNLDLLNNSINECEGSGIIFYTPSGTNSLIANISGNAVSNCLNLSSNAASGISLDYYTNITSIISNNTLLNNTSPSVAIGANCPGNRNVCLTLTGNSSDSDVGYLLINGGTGAFNLSPCNVATVNIGPISTLDTIGAINAVQSCPDAAPCPP